MSYRMKKYSLQYLTDNIIKEESYVDLEIFKYELDIVEDTSLIDSETNTRLKCYPLARHLCTDTMVGYKCYYFDDKFVCMSYQSSRKSSETIVGWVSQESSREVKEYIISLVPKKDTKVEVLDMSEESEGYLVEYAGTSCAKYILYKDEMCKVLKDKWGNSKNFHTITIAYKSKELDVDIRDCISPFRVEENKKYL